MNDIDERISPVTREAVSRALHVLGIDHFVLIIHDPSFPQLEEEDLGRGSPYARGGRRFLEFARALGFNGVQLGPQGMTSRHNPSPYDGTIFSREPLSIALAELCEEPWKLLSRDDLAREVAVRPSEARTRVPHAHVYDVQYALLRRAFARLQARGGFNAALAEFANNNPWLQSDALYAPLCAEHGSDWSIWTGAMAQLDQSLWILPETAEKRDRQAVLASDYTDEVAFYIFAQYLVYAQHNAWRLDMNALGLRVYGDFQVGYARQDLWRYQQLFLRGYRMGAPPSRTNPEGQPWGYPVLDPGQYEAVGGLGPALALLSARVAKQFGEYDRLRIDHPHGLVCPWVYRAHGDPYLAVRAGARLFASPDVVEHPTLARFALVDSAQLNRDVPRHADDWVRDLSEAQIDAYARSFSVVVDAARAKGRQASDLVCEVLSTQPATLAAVLGRYGLGRFRVTQKAQVHRPDDVYRSENATPADWVMVGNHDTPSLWHLCNEWERRGEIGAQADYLAARLSRTAGAERDALRRRLGSNVRELAMAKFAELFVSPARNVMVFFSDLLGMKDFYNRPGVVSPDNWSLRVPPDYMSLYVERVARGEALSIPRALAMALRVKGTNAELCRRLEEGF